MNIKKEKTIREIGRSAEEIINKDLRKWSTFTKNKFINSSLFKYSNNKMFEVDSIVITSKAIIVVEIKSIKGNISGDCKEPYFIKEVNKKEFRITNPIIQNDKHIQHIVNMTKFNVPIISLIIFSNRASDINVKNIPTHAIITKHIDLFKKLDEIDLSLPVRIDSAKLKTIQHTILKFKTNKKDDVKRFKEITGGK